MNTKEIIFKDLIEFLKKNGITSKVVESKMTKSEILEVVFEVASGSSTYWFDIYGGSICSHKMVRLNKSLSVSLADPQYREKFLESCVMMHKTNESRLAELLKDVR